MRILLAVLWLVSATAAGQSARAPESLRAWPYYKELRGPEKSEGLSEVLLDREVLDKGRTDLADLRLYDDKGREIPHAVRVLRDLDDHQLREGMLFNKVVDGGSAVVSVDLGETPQQHNLLDVETGGTNFRRFATLEASADGAHWSTLAAQVVLFRFAANGQALEQHRIPYAENRLRYLRIHVTRDPQSDNEPPSIQAVLVQRRVEAKGEMSQFPLSVGERAADRRYGRPASVWHFDAHARVPISRIQFSVTAGKFSRLFELTSVDDAANPRVLASGDLHEADLSSGAPVVIDFPEQFTQHLKLTVVDDRNEPLVLYSATALCAARQVLFEPVSGVVRLYYGNADALAPHYDLNARLDARVTAALSRLPLLAQRDNPEYSPKPKPFTERHPWLVYVILTLACATLAGLLRNVLQAARAVGSGNPAPENL